MFQQIPSIAGSSGNSSFYGYCNGQFNKNNWNLLNMPSVLTILATTVRIREKSYQTGSGHVPWWSRRDVFVSGLELIHLSPSISISYDYSTPDQHKHTNRQENTGYLPLWYIQYICMNNSLDFKCFEMSSAHPHLNLLQNTVKTVKYLYYLK